MTHIEVENDGYGEHVDYYSDRDPMPQRDNDREMRNMKQ
jgi:hypothetical protein